MIRQVRPTRNWALERAREGKLVLDIYTSEARAREAMRLDVNTIASAGVGHELDRPMRLRLYESGGAIDYTWSHQTMTKGIDEQLRNCYDAVDGTRFLPTVPQAIEWWLETVVLAENGEYIA